MSNENTPLPVAFDTKSLYPALQADIEQDIQFLKSEIEGDRRILVLDSFEGVNKGLQAFIPQYNSPEEKDEAGNSVGILKDIQHFVDVYGPVTARDALNNHLSSGLRIKAKAKVPAYSDAEVQKAWLTKALTENPVLITPEDALAYRPGVRTPTDASGWMNAAKRLMAEAKKLVNGSDEYKAKVSEARDAMNKAQALLQQAMEFGA